VLAVLDVTLFVIAAEFPQKLRQESQREPGQDRGRDYYEYHACRKRINKPRCYFIQPAHSVTSNVRRLNLFRSRIAYLGSLRVSHSLREMPGRFFGHLWPLS